MLTYGFFNTQHRFICRHMVYVAQYSFIYRYTDLFIMRNKVPYVHIWPLNFTRHENGNSKPP